MEGRNAVGHQIFRFPFAPICMDYSFSSGLMYLHLAEVYGLKPWRLSIVYCNFVNTPEFVFGVLVLFLLTYILTYTIYNCHLVCGINYTCYDLASDMGSI